MLQKCGACHTCYELAPWALTAPASCVDTPSLRLFVISSEGPSILLTWMCPWGCLNKESGEINEGQEEERLLSLASPHSLWPLSAQTRNRFIR